MASNMPRTAATFSSPSGSVSGIEESGIDRIVRARPRGAETLGRGGRAYAAGA
jgi:hypothetical protein